MAIAKHTAGKELSPEKQTAMKAEIEAAARRPYIYDPDSPLLTEKQLSEFRPVNFNSMEDREHAMQNSNTPIKTKDKSANGKRDYAGISRKKS